MWRSLDARTWSWSLTPPASHPQTQGFSRCVNNCIDCSFTLADIYVSQAESLSNHLGVPVLIHNNPKPANSVVKAIEKYFGGFPLPNSNLAAKIIIPTKSIHPTRPHSVPKLLVIGDRISTDLILASRLRLRLGSVVHDGGEVLGVLTDRIWSSESFGTRFMRWVEVRMSAGIELESGFNEARRKELEKCFTHSTNTSALKDHDSQNAHVVRTPISGTPWSLRTYTLHYLQILRAHLRAKLNVLYTRLVDLLLQLVRKQVGRFMSFYHGSYGLGFRVPKDLEQLRMWKSKQKVYDK